MPVQQIADPFDVRRCVPRFDQVPDFFVMDDHRVRRSESGQDKGVRSVWIWLAWFSRHGRGKPWGCLTIPAGEGFSAPHPFFRRFDESSEGLVLFSFFQVGHFVVRRLLPELDIVEVPILGQLAALDRGPDGAARLAFMAAVRISAIRGSRDNLDRKSVV